LIPSEPFDDTDHDEANESEHSFGFYAGGRPPHLFASHEFPDGATEHQSCCPKCHSPQIEPRHVARRVAAVIGVLAGATNGVVRALQAAEVISSGVKFGVAAGIRSTGGPIVGTVASALAAALLEGAAGCALGVRFGDAIDRMILPSYRCVACDHTFSTPIDSAD